MPHSLDDLQRLCGEIGLSCRISNNALLVPLTRAEDPERPIYNVFLADNEKQTLCAYAISVGFEIPEEKQLDAFLVCNRWNRDRSLTRAYLADDRELRVEFDLPDQGLSDEYIRESFLREFVSASGDFFEFAANVF